MASERAREQAARAMPCERGRGEHAAAALPWEEGEGGREGGYELGVIALRSLPSPLLRSAGCRATPPPPPHSAQA